MPSLKSIRKRISSVKNTQKITKAMKVVAAAKLRRVQDSVHALRPYARRMQKVVTNLAAYTASLEDESVSNLPSSSLLFTGEEKRVLLFVITSDRGLAGSFNSSVCRRAERFIRDNDSKNIEIAIIGKKAREYFQRMMIGPLEGSENGHVLQLSQSEKQFSLVHSYPGINANDIASFSTQLATLLLKTIGDKQFDAVYGVYNEAKTSASYTLQVKRLLPLFEAGKQLDVPPEFVYEPGYDQILKHLLPLHVEVQLQRILLESSTAEFRARMMAMDNASRNAKEMISRLTLQFNRARQASITKELMEIVGGAEALKG